MGGPFPFLSSGDHNRSIAGDGSCVAVRYIGSGANTPRWWITKVKKPGDTHTMKIRTLLAVTLLAGLPLGALAVAQSPGQPSAATTESRGKVRTACADDIQKFCATVERAKGAMRDCMQANESKLSATCKAARAERAAARAKDKS